MKEQEKLGEAEYFYPRMIAEQYDQLHFKYNLSAFIHAARSVLEYAGKELNSRKNRSVRQVARAWYDQKVIPGGILYFFGGERINNFHHSPVTPGVNITLQPDECFQEQTSDHLSLNGPSPVEIPPPPVVVREKEFKPPPSPPEYKFTDWPGMEDIPTLCRKYLGELEQFIKEGVSLGYISG
ncbi:MAG: hypothetical protein ABSG73_15130 [Candidatus Aminicenantales bacterium]|jgi:hypothetical protein